MKISSAFERFEAALKAMRAAEIAALGAEDEVECPAAARLRSSREEAQSAAIALWSLPARGPADLVIKARALRWHFPDGVEIKEQAQLGVGEPAPDMTHGALAVHYIIRDLMALAE